MSTNDPSLARVFHPQQKNGEDMVSGQRVRVEKPGTQPGDTSGRWVATIEDEPVAWRRTRDAAIRAGLLALAEREEARG